MKVTMTIAQLKRFSDLESAFGKELIAFAVNGGKGPTSDVLNICAHFGLIKVIGGNAFATFEIDGVKPLEKFPVARKKKEASTMQVFYAIWRHKAGQCGGAINLTGKEISLMKNCSGIYSVEEYTKLVASFFAYEASFKGVPTFTEFYNRRHKISGATNDSFA